MSNQAVQVYVDLNGRSIHVGQLWSRIRKGKESASFEYSESWLNNPQRFAFDPNLRLGSGLFHTQNNTLFGAIGDSAPDRWGRMLIKRQEIHNARQAGISPKTLNEIDYLLAVNDIARQGALRFCRNDGIFLAKSGKSVIPLLVNIQKLLAASERVLKDEETDADLKILFAPGTSLGGARPKATVTDKKGNLLIAKFPRFDDTYDCVLWESVALQLAKMAKINTPPNRIEKISKHYVLLIDRFDRDLNMRIPFISAMSMLGAQDNEEHSYLELVDIIKQHGSQPRQDLHELWRRIVFSIFIANVDDHLRNHGFLYDSVRGWKLSPIYDINPTPKDIKDRYLTTNITLDDNTASLDVAMQVIADFALTITEAKQIIADVAAAVGEWRKVASATGIKKNEIERMSSAFAL
jgi:serine/threonine-protein kinase HipA